MLTLKTNKQISMLHSLFHPVSRVVFLLLVFSSSDVISHRHHDGQRLKRSVTALLYPSRKPTKPANGSLREKKGGKSSHQPSNHFTLTYWSTANCRHQCWSNPCAVHNIPMVNSQKICNCITSLSVMMQCIKTSTFSFSQLTSLMVSVDIKQHVYVLTACP